MAGLEEWRWDQPQQWQHSHANGPVAEKYANELGELAGKGFDIDKVVAIAATCKLVKGTDVKPRLGSLPATPVKIAVAKDEAFSFYYHE